MSIASKLAVVGAMAAGIYALKKTRAGASKRAIAATKAEPAASGTKSKTRKRSQRSKRSKQARTVPTAQ